MDGSLGGRGGYLDGRFSQRGVEEASRQFCSLLASVIVKLRCSRLGVVWLGVGSSEFRIIAWV